MTEAEFQIFLDEGSDCFISGDFAQWASMVVLPFTMVTKDGPVTLSDLDDLRQNFDLYVAAGRILRIDLISRRAISLEDCGDGTFIGTLETEILSHGARIVEPYTASVLLHNRGGKWKMSTVMSSHGNYQWTEISRHDSGDPE